ncbi:MAG: DUF4357 domain-containing protein [Chitinophagales bacterium]
MNTILDNIRLDKDGLLNSSEESIKTSIILRILQKLGWDIFDHKELKAEYTNGRGRVDYALCDRDNLKILIEAKNANENLENHEEQLLKYSFEVGVELAILTNGFTWWFYLPLEKGHWKDRKFLTIDILNQSNEIIIERFQRFLSKENILNGQSEKSAKETYNNSKIKENVKNELPIIWSNLLKKPDDLLIDLLKEEVEKKLGYTFDINLIKDFLKNVPIHNYEQTLEVKPIPLKNKIENIERDNTPKVQYRLQSDVTATGFFSGHSNFTILKGSKIRGSVSPNFNTNPQLQSQRKLRNELIKTGKISNNTFITNYEFSSPSQAATIILGRAANGNKEFNIK